MSGCTGASQRECSSISTTRNRLHSARHGPFTHATYLLHVLSASVTFFIHTMCLFFAGRTGSDMRTAYAS